MLGSQGSLADRPSSREVQDGIGISRACRCGVLSKLVSSKGALEHVRRKTSNIRYSMFYGRHVPTY